MLNAKVATGDGAMGAYVAMPKNVTGPAPAVVILMEVFEALPDCFECALSLANTLRENKAGRQPALQRRAPARSTLAASLQPPHPRAGTGLFTVV